MIPDLFGRVMSRCELAEILEAGTDGTQVSGQSQQGLRRTKGHGGKQEMTSEETTRGLSVLRAANSWVKFHQNTQSELLHYGSLLGRY